MDSFQSVLGDAAGGALCNLLTAYGASAPLLRAISLIEPTPIGEGLAISAGLAGLAATVGCTWNPDGPGPSDPGGSYSGCKKFSSGYGNLYYTRADGSKGLVSSYVVEMLFLSEPILINPGGQVYQVIIEFRDKDNKFQRSELNTIGKPTNFRVEPVESTNPVCEEPAPVNPIPTPEPYKYTDPESGCEINVDFQGWALGEAGNVGGVWLMTPATEELQNSGGIIGGCNFYPTIYYDGGGGGGGPTSFPVPDPLPPDGDEPWWAPLLRGAAAGTAAALVGKALEALFEPVFPGGSYSVDGVCEVDSNGDPMPVTYSSNYAPGKAFAAIIDRLDALGDLPNYSKQLRQPTCMGCVKQGAPVTIHFESLAPSINGMAPLRKQLTYYDQTGSPLQVHASHWKDFSWESGPFVVTHQGANWGKLVVWGATAEEGKRVIRHAGEVAGINPDASGYWHVQESSAPRYGRRGTMRVEIRPKRGNGNRYLMVTKRDSPNGLPLAMVLSASDF